MFFRGSRYETIADAETLGRDGRAIRYKRMRFIPEVASGRSQKVRDDDRPDLLAYRALGDAEQFWRLADVDRTLRPSELTREPGRAVRLPNYGGG